MLNILGVNISTLNKKQVLGKIQSFLKDGKSHYIVTPNPEIILQAGKNEELFYILNKASMSLPDGIGLKFASWFMGKNIQRITGADLVCDILKIAEDKKFKLLIINKKNGLSTSKDIEQAISKQYKKLNFKIIDIDIQQIKKNQKTIKNNNFDIALVALGAPHQEKFIYHSLVKSGSAPAKARVPKLKVKSQLSIGIGGSLDFLTGKIKRAPKLMRFIGLEWIWRLIKQPSRLKRIYNAVIVFSFKFLKWRFISPFLYRPNVACMLYKKKDNKYKILLAEREDDPGHWQLPQGGTDGETLWQAGERELKEEISCNKFKPVAVFPNLWKYKFGAEEKKFVQDEKGKIKKHLGYKGQKQGLFIAEFLGKDTDITINFWDHKNWKWVDANNFINEVHDTRKKSAKIFLKYFKQHITHNT